MPSDAAQKIADHNARVHAANAPPDDPAVAADTTAAECLSMIREVLVLRLGEDEMQSVPPMFYPEAILRCVRRALDIAHAEVDAPAVAARIAADALLRETTAGRDALLICHADVPDGTTGKGCGREIPHGEEYRCLDCAAVMHRDCLRWHCSADEKDRAIWDLQGTIAALRAQLEWLAEPSRGEG